MSAAGDTICHLVNSSERMQRDQSVDCARAVAVILVTFFHVWRAIDYPSINLPGGFDLLAPLKNGWIGVGLFFVISGYCMGPSADRSFPNGLRAGDYGRYFLKRLFRIAVPYYASIAVWYWLINAYEIAPKATGLNDIVSHLLFVHNFSESTFFSISGVYWSIAPEMQFYILLPVLLALFTTASSRVVLLIGSAGLMVAVSLLPGTSHPLKWGLLNYFFLFVFGWLLSCYREAISTRLMRWKALPSIGLCLTILLFRGVDQGAAESRVFEALLSVLAGLMLVVASTSDGARNTGTTGQILAFIGRCSFSIYLYNYILYAVRPTGANIAVFVSLVTTVLGFGVLMYYLVEFNSEKLRRRVFRPRAVARMLNDSTLASAMTTSDTGRTAAN